MPIIGRVAAGEPILAQENIENYFPIPAEMMPNKQTFLLVIKGESMVNKGILDRDYVIVEKCNLADNGQIVVAMVEDSATVKTYYQEDGHVRLQPENDFMDPIILQSEDNLQIIGKVIGVFRMIN